MPRTPRQKSPTGVYHATLRGVGGLAVFEDTLDKRVFLGRVRGLLEDEPDIAVLAWCLMDNHVHLLVDDPADVLSRFVARLAGPYALWFNRRHGHTGHVFEARHHTTSVMTDAQLMATVRYIHQNPVRAGLARDCDVPWSSYREYLQGAGLVDLRLLDDLFGGLEGFVGFHAQLPDPVEELGLRRGSRRRVSDEDADAAVASVLGEEPLKRLASLDRPARNRVLAQLKALRLSARQIQLRTGIGRGIIERA